MVPLSAYDNTQRLTRSGKLHLPELAYGRWFIQFQIIILVVTIVHLVQHFLGEFSRIFLLFVIIINVVFFLTLFYDCRKEKMVML